MTLAHARKFTFDLDLAAAPREPARTVAQGEVDALVEAARAEGYRQGHADGERAAQAGAEQALAGAAELLAARAAECVENLGDRHAELLAQTTRLSLTIGRKLAAHLIARHPTGELEALIEDALASLESAPHLVIRCHPDLTDTVKAAAEARIATASFTGRLVVMGDPEIGLGDGRLEWVDGGLVRDLGAIGSAIDEKITAYLAAHGAAASKESRR